MKRRALFLDRDGTLMIDSGYPSDPKSVQILDDAPEVLLRAQSAGYRLIIVSNQSGVSRGYFSEETMWEVHRRFAELYGKHGVRFDYVQYCTDSPLAPSNKRKPSPVMLLEAQHELQLDMRKSFMIGDKCSDVMAGQRADCQSIYFRSDANFTGLCNADHKCTRWNDIWEILKNAG